MNPRVIPGPPTRFRGEAYYLPYANRVWLPIRKNGHTSILTAIQSSGQPWLPIHTTEHRFASVPRVAIWRNPFDRMVAAYNTFPQAKPFNDWVLDICAQRDEDRDPHWMSQDLSTRLIYPEGPDEVILWDFDKLGKILGLTIPHTRAEDDRSQKWDHVTRHTYRAAYDADFVVWSHRP